MLYSAFFSLFLINYLFANGAIPDGDPSYTAKDSLEGCMASVTPPGVSRWENNTGAIAMTVEWQYGQYTCFNQQTCYGVTGDHGHDPTLVQMVPIEIQQGLTLRFKSSKMMGPMRTYRVTQEDFASCSFRHGTPVVDSMTVQAFEVNSTFLQPGHNYFIAKTKNSEFKCEYGLRLDVLVKTHICSQADSIPMCSARGHCHSRRKEDHYLCDCCLGFAGKFCEDVDGCVHSTCKNGATCVDVPNDPTGTQFTCSCPAGFNGTFCENIVETMCDLQPCLNNATCVGNKTHYSCQCTHEFKGERCQTSRKYCTSNPCVNGLCVERPLTDSFQCYCIPGHGGQRCEHEYNECQSNPCKNSGKCVDKVNGFDCVCSKGYTGKDCSLKIDLCLPNPCERGVKCIDFGNDFACICPQGTSGKHCSVDINECASSPCQNGGTCVDGHARYTCTCPHLTSGLHCEVTLDGFVRDKSLKESRPFGNENAVADTTRGLHVVIGTLGGALFLVLLILAILYCRMNKSRIGLVARIREMAALRANRKVHPEFDIPLETVSEPYLSRAAIYECTPVEYVDSPLDIPLVSNTLKPKKV